MNMSLRQERMRLLALAPETSLDEALSGISLPGYRIVRGPETGLVMARGRVGNVGDVFNVGEVLVTRCVVQLEEKTLGHAWIMGESPRHAELAALCDALWQQESYAALLDEKLRPCLEQAIDEKRKAAARDAAGTKVNFFTFVRGEDQWAISNVPACPGQILWDRHSRCSVWPLPRCPGLPRRMLSCPARRIPLRMNCLPG